MKNKSNNTSQKDKMKMKKFDPNNLIARFLSLFSIIISIVSICISNNAKQISEYSAPLSYNVEQVISNYSSDTNDTFETQVELDVKSGAIGNIYLIDYRDGIILKEEKMQGGTITSHSSKKESTLSYKIEYDRNENGDEFIITNFLLVEGRDESLHLGMIRYHINLTMEKIDVKYYSTTDLKVALKNPLEEQYIECLSDFEELSEYFNIS